MDMRPAYVRADATAIIQVYFEDGLTRVQFNEITNHEGLPVTLSSTAKALRTLAGVLDGIAAGQVDA